MLWLQRISTKRNVKILPTRVKVKGKTIATKNENDTYFDLSSQRMKS
jgi:hypothetical protein